MSFAPSLPALIGPAENSLRVLLIRTLSTTRIKSYQAWVTLNAASSVDVAKSDEKWLLQVAGTLKVELGEVKAIVAQLCTEGLLSGDTLLTAQGKAELTKGRSAVLAVTKRVVEGISEDQQAMARLVLEHVRRKAEELLSE